VGAWLTGAVAEPVPRRWTREEYYCMGEAGVFVSNGHVELIEGEILHRSPQGPLHSVGTSRLYRVIGAAFGPGFYVRSQLPLALGQRSDPEPDLVVVPGAPEDYEDAHPTTALLVVEVSDTTLAYDRTIKAGLYARAGIADYWIVNLVDHLIEVHRDPQPDATSPLGASYGQVIRHGRGAVISPLAAPQAQIAVDNLLPRPRQNHT
jgi:Uma2 family endonuclease